jgi:methionine-rich copper-binding protein CopC
MPGDERRSRGVALGVAAFVLGLACVGAGPVRPPVASADPADSAATEHVAHAKITGSEPGDGATVERAPDVVTLAVDAKPATVEGDPLQVYGPGGRRLDDGDISLADEGRRISVGLTPTLDRPAGRYEIVYRIVSADTHLIAGRLEFTAQTAVPATSALAQGPADVGPATPAGDGIDLGEPLHGWPSQAWPPLVAAVALLLAGARVMWRRRRSAERLGRARTR